MTETLESLGYLGAFLGAILEGEILFMTTVQTARMGYLNVYLVLLAVAAGTMSADWFFYLAGRSKGRSYIQKYPGLEKRFSDMAERLDKNATLFLISYRFLYGFRMVLPVLFGASGISPLRFAFFNLISTALWIACFGYIGYHFTGLLLQKITQLQSWSWLIVLLISGIFLVLAHYWRVRETT